MVEQSKLILLDRFEDSHLVIKTHVESLIHPLVYYGENSLELYIVNHSLCHRIAIQHLFLFCSIKPTFRVNNGVDQKNSKIQTIKISLIY